MKVFVEARLAKTISAIALGASLAAQAPAAALSSNPIVVAVKHGDCAKAVELVNPSLAANNDQTTIFLAARMLDEGICVQKDPVTAAQYFDHATSMGDKDAGLDHAAKIGLGVGTEQSYERAGDICRIAGIDREGRMSRYALGYSCTVLGVAGRLLRETLPKGAFRPGGPVLVEFSPASAEMQIRSTPPVGLADAPTGSNMRTPLVDAHQVIQKAWRDALAAVPKPDAAQLGSQDIELSLDVDMTLEAGRNAAQDTQGFRGLLNGDVQGTAR